MSISHPLKHWNESESLKLSGVSSKDYTRTLIDEAQVFINLKTDGLVYCCGYTISQEVVYFQEFHRGDLFEASFWIGSDLKYIQKQLHDSCKEYNKKMKPKCSSFSAIKRDKSFSRDYWANIELDLQENM